MLCQLLMFDDYSTAAETTPHVLDLATFEDICRRKFGISTHEVSPERLRVLFRVLDDVLHMLRAIPLVGLDVDPDPLQVLDDLFDHLGARDPVVV